jgi:SAM-dependent methyltransferase
LAAKLAVSLFPTNTHPLKVSRIPVTTQYQLKRQLDWMREPWLWLLRSSVLNQMKNGEMKPTALDVGCGPGLVMQLFSQTLDVRGVDIDPEMVRMAQQNGLDVVQGDAANLPFDDNSFDVVYCSFTLLWIKDPQRALREMTRVSRRFVICLAEPDYGGRICYPKEVADLDPLLVASLKDRGADPYIGRRLCGLMETAGLTVQTGINPGIWSSDQLRREADAEWDSIVNDIVDRIDKDSLAKAKAAWVSALADRSLFLFNPVFYAIGEK